MYVTILGTQCITHIAAAILLLLFGNNTDIEEMKCLIVLEVVSKEFFDVLVKTPRIARITKLPVGIGCTFLFTAKWASLLVTRGNRTILAYMIGVLLLQLSLMVYNVFDLTAYRRFMTLNI